MKRKFFAVISILILVLAALPAFAGAAPNNDDGVINLGANTDNPSHPLGDKQSALRDKGFEAKVNGKTSGPVAEVAKGQFVELEREGEDSIFTVIAEFGPADHPAPILYLWRPRTVA